MNWPEIHYTLRMRFAQTGDERALYVARRVNRLLKKRARRARWTDKVQIPVKLEDTNHYNQLMKHIRAGSKIIAIDNEWTPRRPITEIGISEFGGKSHNVRLTPGGKEFRHGTTRYMTDEQAKLWLAQQLEGVDLIIGHMFKNDVRQYAKWGFEIPKIPLLDTGLWSKALFPPNHMSLKHMAEKYGINAAGWHCAGNDAYITLMVAMTMAGIENA